MARERRAVKQSAREVLFTDGQRNILSALVEESVIHALSKVLDVFGVDPETHKEDHKDFKLIKPWIAVQMDREKAKTRLYEKLQTDAYMWVFKGILLVTALTIAYGLFPALRHLLFGAP
jgi:hypothetical protein